MVLRVLIGVACLAVIGFVANFAIGEYQSYVERTAASARARAVECERYIVGSDNLMRARMSGINEPPASVHAKAATCREKAQ